MFRICCMLQYSSKRFFFFFFCESEAVFVLSWTFEVTLGCVYLRQCGDCLCLCVGLRGKCSPAVVMGRIDRRLCATHVKFMFCAAFTKEPWNGFCGKITPQQREDGAKDNEMDGK